MKASSKKRTAAGVLCLGMLMQTAAYLPANADDLALLKKFIMGEIKSF